MKIKRLLLVWLIVLSGCVTLEKAPHKNLPRDNKMLTGFRIALLVTDGFEQVEMTKPRKALEDAGATVTLISPKETKVRGYNQDKKGDSFSVDLPLEKASSQDFDALLLPGGVKNPDKLRLNPQAIAFIKGMGKARKPIAAICHGPWTLINAGLVKGRTVTSWPSLEADLKNAGAHWVDREVVVDKNLITSRKPEDIPAFNEAMIKVFAHAHR